MTPRALEIARFGVTLMGVALAGAGAFLAWPPAGLMTWGALLIVAGLVPEIRRRG